MLFLLILSFEVTLQFIDKQFSTSVSVYSHIQDWLKIENFTDIL